LKDAARALSGGLDRILKMYDFNTQQGKDCLYLIIKK
jgi:hypothetical protein